MKRTFKVFMADARRLSSNVVAIVIIMGLSIIPALYAWFNIMSNWDPYGESATSQMHIAVYSEDKGVTYDKFKLCMGDTVVEGLESNKTIGWIFSDTKEDAMEEVYSGDCYATFIIPENFTEDMLSFLSGDPVNPQIEYYENSKKNAIATKITSKVKTTVQQTVNTSVVSNITKIASQSGEAIVGSSQDINLLGNIVSKLKEMDSSLSTYSDILSTFALLTDSAGELVGSTQSLLPGIEGMIDNGQSTVNGMQGSVLSGAQTASTISSMVDISLGTVKDQLDLFNGSIKKIDVNTDISLPQANFDALNELANNTFDVISDLGIADQNDLASAKENFNAIGAQMESLKSDASLTAEKLEALKQSIEMEVSACQSAIDELKGSFDYDITPKISDSVYDMEYALIETQTLLGSLDDSFPDINNALDSYAKVLESGNADIVETKEYVDEIRNGLSTVINGLNDLENDEQYQEVTQMLKTDPTLIADFVTSPISMDEQKIYEIKNYGSAMSPFYTVLALWVGGLINVALIHVKVKDNKEIEGVKGRHKYFGRYIVFFLIGQVQTLITVLGDLYFVDIQCKHRFLFWLACSITSLMFTIFMYSLTVAFGNVGEAVAVVVMVIQVAGAGGTFPVEVLPEVYRMIYKYLPFTYAMNALRECVGGMYRFTYAKCLGVLGIYIVISIIIGLFLGRPFKKLNEAIEKSKERSGLMI